MRARPHLRFAAAARLRRGVLLGLVAASVLTAAGAPTRRFEISAGDARTTLRLFSAQSGQQLVYLVDEINGLRTHGVRGQLAPRDALGRMLVGTELAIMEDEVTGALAVSRSLAVPAEAPVVPRPARRRPPSPFPDTPVRLDLFEVVDDPEHGYGVLESNALTAFSLDLMRMPATVQVFRNNLADDVAATSLEDLLIGYSGTVTAASDNPGSQIDMPGDRNGGQGLSIRGVSAGEIKRDGFIGPPNSMRTAGGYTDGFSVERVEVIEGPQSLLYGSVGGGGVINAVSKRAQFGENRGSVSLTVDGAGSRRAVADLNAAGGSWAVRLALVGDHHRVSGSRLGHELTGAYAQFAFQLGPSSSLRLTTERTENDARVSFRPNLNAFFEPGDPRIGQDSRYLALTGQLDDLDILRGGTDQRNLESLGSWWSGERIRTHWSSLTLDSRLSRHFSAQFTAIYSETYDLRAADGRTLLPARGRPGSGGNPFDVTAVQIGSPVKVNEQRDRNKGAKLVVVHEADFALGWLSGRSRTALGGQAFLRGPSFGSSGIAHAYFLADAAWQPVVDPALTLDYGRVPLAAVHFPVGEGVPARPHFRPGTRRVTLDGMNYVLQPRIAADPSRATPENPYGLIPNRPTATDPGGFADVWNRGGETHSGSAFVTNFTDWGDGRLSTLVGYSLTRFETINVSPRAVTRVPKDTHPGWQVAASGRITPSLSAYVALGTSERAEASTTDIYGVPLRNPEARAVVPEVGLKAALPDGRFALQLSYSPETRTLNENQNTGDTSFRDAINPGGINGRVGGADANQRVNLDRTLTAASFVLTARPARDWHLRLLVSHLDGEISRTVAYRQVYNDQFHTAGDVVTHADGTPLLVDPTGGAGGARVPLTLSMVNTPGDPYHAMPDRVSGAITNPLLRDVLTTVDAVHGPVATGAVGLPMSAMQYDFRSPYTDGLVVIYRAGEKNTGFNEFTFNLQSRFEFSSGPLRGAGVVCDLRACAKNRAYHVNYPGANGSTLGTDVERRLFRLPDSVLFNLGLIYRRKLGDHIAWSTQLTIRNVFDDDRVWVVPNPANGSLRYARLSAQPREWVWTNTFSF